MEEQPKEYVILATRYEGGINKEYGAPFYGPDYAGYTHRLTGAGLYAKEDAEREAERASGLVAYHFADPKLRDYLNRRMLLRGAEFDLFHEVRALRAAAQTPGATGAAGEAGQGAWVACADRLPEKTGGYLCQCDDGNQMVCLVNVLGDWTAYPGGCFYGDLSGGGLPQPDRSVTHWMPLPTPPTSAAPQTPQPPQRQEGS